jgi:hypothetical protein
VIAQAGRRAEGGLGGHRQAEPALVPPPVRQLLLLGFLATVATAGH